MSKTFRPETLAAELGVSGKVLRAYLRATFPRPVTAKGTTWVVTGAQATKVRKHFKSQRGVTPPKPVKRVTTRKAVPKPVTPSES